MGKINGDNHISQSAKSTGHSTWGSEKLPQMFFGTYALMEAIKGNPNYLGYLDYLPAINDFVLAELYKRFEKMENAEVRKVKRSLKQITANCIITFTCKPPTPLSASTRARAGDNQLPCVSRAAGIHP